MGAEILNFIGQNGGGGRGAGSGALTSAMVQLLEKASVGAWLVTRPRGFGIRDDFIGYGWGEGKRRKDEICVLLLT